MAVLAAGFYSLCDLTTRYYADICIYVYGYMVNVPGNEQLQGILFTLAASWPTALAGHG